MDAKDVEAAFKAYEQSNRESWEQTRILAYNIVAPYMKQPQNLSSFMPLPWDHNNKPEVEPPTREDFERLKKRFNLN